MLSSEDLDAKSLQRDFCIAQDKLQGSIIVKDGS
jgi:hypothetical protein